MTKRRLSSNASRKNSGGNSQTTKSYMSLDEHVDMEALLEQLTGGLE
jgi:hypothetical protein